MLFFAKGEVIKSKTKDCHVCPNYCLERLSKCRIQHSSKESWMVLKLNCPDVRHISHFLSGQFVIFGLGSLGRCLRHPPGGRARPWACDFFLLPPIDNDNTLLVRRPTPLLNLPQKKTGARGGTRMHPTQAKNEVSSTSSTEV